MKLQCKVLPYFSLHSFVQPTLPYLTLLCYTYLVISTSLIHKLMKYTTEMWKCSNVLNFIAFFVDICLRPLPPFHSHPHYFGNEMCEGGIYIMQVSFTISICKYFGNCRKHHFKLPLGGFLALTPQNIIVNFACIFDQ